MADEYVSLDSAARMLNVSRRTVQRRVSAGELPAYRPTNRARRLVRVQDLVRLQAPIPTRNQAGKSSA